MKHNFDAAQGQPTTPLPNLDSPIIETIRNDDDLFGRIIFFPHMHDFYIDGEMVEDEEGNHTERRAKYNQSAFLVLGYGQAIRDTNELCFAGVFLNHAALNQNDLSVIKVGDVYRKTKSTEPDLPAVCKNIDFRLGGFSSSKLAFLACERHLITDRDSPMVLEDNLDFGFVIDPTNERISEIFTQSPEGRKPQFFVGLQPIERGELYTALREGRAHLCPRELNFLDISDTVKMTQIARLSTEKFESTSGMTAPARMM